MNKKQEHHLVGVVLNNNTVNKVNNNKNKKQHDHLVGGVLNNNTINKVNNNKKTTWLAE